MAAMPLLFNDIAAGLAASAIPTDGAGQDHSLSSKVHPRYIIYYNDDTTRYRIIGSVCAVAAVVISITVTLLWWRRRQRRKNQQGHPSVQLRDMTTTSGNATELGATLTNYISGLTHSQFDYIPRNIAKGDNGSCNLCLSAIVTGDDIVNLHPCSHKFHTDCARSWFTHNSTMCPICGTDIAKAMGLPPQMYDSSRDNNARNSFMAMPEVNHSYSYQQDNNSNNNNSGSMGYPTVPDQAHHSTRPSHIL